MENLPFLIGAGIILVILIGAIFLGHLDARLDDERKREAFAKAERKRIKEENLRLRKMTRMQEIKAGINPVYRLTDFGARGNTDEEPIGIPCSPHGWMSE